MAWDGRLCYGSAMAEETYRIAYTMQRSDYVAMCLALFRPTLRVRLIKIGVFIVLAAIVLFIAGRGYEDFGRFVAVMANAMPWWFYPLILGAGLLIFYSHWISCLYAWSWFGKMTPADKDVTITFNAAGVELESRTASSKLKWDAFVRLIRERDQVFMALARSVAIIVPRRAFSSDAEFEAFWSFVGRQVAAGTSTE